MNSSKVNLIGLVSISFFILAILIFNPSTPIDLKNTKQTASVGIINTSGQTYYVDDKNGNDDNSGTSIESPWKTVGKVNQMMANFKSGDVIAFNRGGIWSEQLTLGQALNGTNHLTINAYGEQNLPKPLFNLNSQQSFGIFLLDRANVAIKDIAVTGFNSDSSESAGIVVANSKNIVLENIDVYDGKGLGGVFLYSSSPKSLESVNIKNLTARNISASLFSRASDNDGNGIHLWGECDSCGFNITIENSSFYNNGDHGIGIFMPNVTARDNKVYNNNNDGIRVGGDRAKNNLIENNVVYSNCQLTDDCFGINFFRSGGNNIIQNNTLSGQHNTLTDSKIQINPGYFSKYGTGGIRFDGGDTTLLNNPLFGIGGDYFSKTGNVIRENKISNEYQGIQIFNYNDVSILRNTIDNSSNWGISVSALNSNLGNVTPPVELKESNGVITIKWGNNEPIALESITRSIDATLSDNLITGKGVSSYKANLIGYSTTTSPTEEIPIPSPSPIIETAPAPEPVVVCTSPKTYYEDKDGDSFGNPQVKLSSCEQPAGYVLNNRDCNDNTKATRRCFSCSVRNSSTCRR